MPELPHFNPTVSVFHFTSKVSSAKIAKYKLATEKGMVVSHATNAATSAKQGKRKETARTSTPDVRPTKRPRLKLKVREPDPVDEDCITVSRPQPITSAPAAAAVNTRKRGWKNAFAQDQAPGSRTRATSISSDRSSCDLQIFPKADGTSAAQATTHKKAQDGYGDFMSYYVLDDDDDDESKPAAVSKRASGKFGQQHAQGVHMSKPTQGIPSGHAHVKSSRPAQPPRHPPHVVSAIAPAAIDIRIRDPDSVPIMIMKIEALSAALTEFGGAPAVPQSPGVQEEQGEDNAVDNFLAMFGEAKPVEKTGDKILNVGDLDNPGVQDHSLTHGIQFIMNALKSWAEQRLAAQRMQMLQQNPCLRRGPGRPKKSPTDGPDDMPPQLQDPPPPMNLFDTPEGRAIAAFRAVVESGCIRVNAVVPVKLAKALRHLYMQIDHLINQTPKTEPAWRCLSYTAQIEANRIRVEKWKEAQFKAQEEMIRQQQVLHQQMMRQMGLPDHLTSTMFYHQNQDPDTAMGECKNVPQDLVRLPTHPRPAAAPPAPPPIIQYRAGHGVQLSSQNPGDPILPRPRPTIEPLYDRDRNISTAFLPRSGQSMKFSFAPTNTAAIQAFGAQAFPSRGPSTSTTPAQIIISSTPPSVEREQIPQKSTNIVEHGLPGHGHPAGKGIKKNNVVHPTPVTSGFAAINRPRNSNKY